MQRLLLFIGFMAFGTGMIYLLTVQESPPVDHALADIPANVLAMEGVIIRQHDSEGLKLELFARSAEFHQRTGESVMRTVRFSVYEYEGGGRKEQIAGTAASALMSKQKGRVELVGRVRIASADGAKISSERIIYDQKKQRAVSPGAVQVESQGIIHRGNSLVYDIPRQKMTFTSPLFYQ